MTSAPSEFRFDRFAISPERRQILVGGQSAKIGARAFDILLALIERRQRVVSKNELLDIVWPDISVEESNLPVHIGALRKLIGPEIIATIPGRGYQFAAAIEGSDSTAAPQHLSFAPVPYILSNLPAQLPALYGRESDVTALGAMIGRERLVCVVGPGGIGKTRVAQAVAHKLRSGYRDGAWIVEFAPIENAELIVSTIARVLGHSPGTKEDAQASLLEAMRGQELLLVLDNCEHIAGAVARLSKAVLARAPGVRILATSQETLKLSEEAVYRLGPLETPDKADPQTALSFGAVALFAARAQAVDSRFTLDSNNVAGVVDICTKLDGIALAIEFAAARISLLGVAGLRQRLSEMINLLSGGAREALPRHRKLRAALEWSYGLLSDDERTVLDRLGAFVGGFSLEAAQMVASDRRIDEWAVLDHLATLIDKSLAIVDAGEQPRYRLLETTRAFALHRLAEAGALEAARARHARAMVTMIAAVPLIHGPSARVAATRFDLDNLRAAAAWATGPGGDRALAIELAGEADYLWYLLGINDEGVKFSRVVEPWLNEATPPAAAARFWLTRSILQTLNAVRHQAVAAEKAGALYRALGDREHLFIALGFQALQHALVGDAAPAQRAIGEAQAMLDPAWPTWTRARIALILGYIEFFCARAPEAARVHMRASYELNHSEGGDLGSGGEAAMGLLLVEYALGNFDKAVAFGQELLTRQPTNLVGYTKAIVSVTLGAALTGIGDLANAELLFRRTLPSIRRATGTASGALNHVAFLVARLRRYADAARLIGYIDGSRNDEMQVHAPSLRRSYDEALAIIAKALKKSEIEKLKSEGRRFSEDEAVALAWLEVD